MRDERHTNESRRPGDIADEEVDARAQLPDDAVTDLAPEESEQGDVQGGSGNGFYEWIKS